MRRASRPDASALDWQDRTGREGASRDEVDDFLDEVVVALRALGS